MVLRAACVALVVLATGASEGRAWTVLQSRPPGVTVLAQDAGVPRHRLDWSVELADVPAGLFVSGEPVARVNLPANAEVTKALLSAKLLLADGDEKPALETHVLEVGDWVDGARVLRLADDANERLTLLVSGGDLAHADLTLSVVVADPAVESLETLDSTMTLGGELTFSRDETLPLAPVELRQTVAPSALPRLRAAQQ